MPAPIQEQSLLPPNCDNEEASGFGGNAVDSGKRSTGLRHGSKDGNSNTLSHGSNDSNSNPLSTSHRVCGYGSVGMTSLIRTWAAAVACLQALCFHGRLPEELLVVTSSGALSATAPLSTAAAGQQLHHLQQQQQQQQQLRSCQMRCLLVFCSAHVSPSGGGLGGGGSTAMTYKDLANCRALCVEEGGEEGTAAAAVAPLLAAALAATAPQTAQVRGSGHESVC